MVESAYMIEYCGVAYVHKLMVICLMLGSGICAYVLRDVARIVSAGFHALSAFLRRR